MQPASLELSPAGVTRTLATVTIMLLALSFGGQVFRFSTGHDHVYGLLALFNVGKEENIPTMFTSFLLLASALLLLMIWRIERARGGPCAGHWLLLACGFAFMAPEEVIGLHERLTEPMRAILGGKDLGALYFAWVVPAAVLLLGLAIAFIPFLRALSRGEAVRFIVSGVVYLGGAIGCELVGGAWAERHGADNLAYQAIVTLEEGMEMAGVVVFIWALLHFIEVHYGEVRIDLRTSAVPPPL